MEDSTASVNLLSKTLLSFNLLPSVFRDVMSGKSLHEYLPRLEPFIRRVVHEEVERAIQSFQDSSPRSVLNQIESSGARAWCLRFLNKFSSVLFTNSKVESEDGEPIKIVLLDTKSNEIVTSGALSSIKVEIVVLDGGFDAGEREGWTENDFDSSVIREREGKRPLVTGDLIITLRNGVGCIKNISFTDNSSWIRSRKFRLGARMQSNSTETRIREAKTEAFIVKDHRGESYKKHHPPALADEIWCLEKIAKDGAFHKRLASFGISTVKDFLRLYIIDPSSLRNVLGGGISNKIWDTIIEHASSCVLDDKRYLYFKATERVGLLFNSIWKVIGATFDGQNYHCLDNFNPIHMRLVEDMKWQAYKNLDELVLVNEQSYLSPPMLLTSWQAEPSNGQSAGLQNVNIPVSDQVELQKQLGSDHIKTLRTYSNEVGDGSQLEVSLAHDHHSIQAFSPTLKEQFRDQRFLYAPPYEGGYSSVPSWSPGSVVMTGNSSADDVSQTETSTSRGNGTETPKSGGVRFELP